MIIGIATAVCRSGWHVQSYPKSPPLLSALQYSTVQSTDYGVGVRLPGNYRGGHLDCQVLRAPQYLNPALCTVLDSVGLCLGLGFEF